MRLNERAQTKPVNGNLAQGLDQQIIKDRITSAVDSQP
jgi:hypothetical protein